MKCFHCDSCGMMVFFENSLCVKCGSQLGFLPDVLDLSALEPAADNQWQARSPQAENLAYRNCANGIEHKTCNWMVPVDDPNLLCASCRLNEIIPNLTDAHNLARWEKLELAKRRCIYAFLKLGLPFDGAAGSNQKPLGFRFLQDKENSSVLTGHQDGIITVNVAEADDDEREHRRLTFHEPYRTLVGHFRHESGHFYWDRLIANTPNLKRFRELFGDETVDYDVALKNYYRQGPATDWHDRTVTAYASSHPWEDWAETWAHYLHIMDTLETAASFGMGVDPDNTANKSSAKISPVKFDDEMDFNALLTDWVPLTCALNSINRGMGLADLYPFVIPPSVVEKLRFVHAVIHEPKRSFRDANEKKPSISKAQLAAA
jgi:hypothetical protein